MPLPTTPPPGPHNTKWTTPPVVPADAVRVLVTGSRDWTHQPTITTALDRLHAEHGGRLVVVHEACPTGADAIADTWAHANAVPVQAHPADWHAHGRAAGPARNAVMVATRPDACLAFIRHHSPGAGIPTTRHTTHPAERSTPLTTPTTAPAAPEPQEPDTSALRAAALSYAARGWHVFPLRPNDKRPAFPNHTADACTGTDPRCRTAGRHVTWQERATTDPDRITRGWSSLPFGIGIACGPSGLVVVDLDVPKPGQTPPPAWQRPGVVDGTDVFTYLCHANDCDAHPATPAVLTCSGGGHLYFAHPDAPDWDGIRLGNTSRALGWLVDTRAWGGYVVAPPTTINHRAYEWVVHAALAPLPDWIGHALHPKNAMPAPTRTPPMTAGQPGTRAERYVQGALDREAAHVRDAQHPGRNHALFAAAANLGELVAGGNLDAEHATAVLTDAARVHIGTQGFTATEAGKTIASGLRKGAGRPRPVTGHAA